MRELLPQAWEQAPVQRGRTGILGHSMGGHGALTLALRTAWVDHDASELMRAQAHAPYPHGVLVDQGLADPFLATQLQPEALEAACAAVGQPLTLRRHARYDHGYYFIATVIEDHLRHHA
jgi:S-formylglutathione hydrolase